MDKRPLGLVCMLGHVDMQMGRWWYWMDRVPMLKWVLALMKSVP